MRKLLLVLALCILYTSGIHAKITQLTIQGPDIGGTKATLVITKQEELDICLNKIKLIKNMTEDQNEENTNVSATINLLKLATDSDVTFDQKDLNMLAQDIIQPLVACKNMNDLQTYAYLKNHVEKNLIKQSVWFKVLRFLHLTDKDYDLETFLNLKRKKLVWMIDNLGIPVYMKTLMDFIIEHPAVLTAIQDKLPGQSFEQELNLRKLVVSPEHVHEILAPANILRRNQLLQELQEYAYDNADKTIITPWMDAVQKHAELLAPAMAGIRQKAQEILGQDNINVTTNLAETQKLFKNLPETVLKMMLSFMSNNTLKDNVDITEVLNRCKAIEQNNGELDLREMLSNIQEKNNILLIVDALYGNQITQLHLYDSRLSQVPDFAHMPNLLKLRLDSNKLTQVPDFAHMPNLQSLDLSANQLTQVPDFAHLQNLQTLDLSHNQLSLVPDFAHMTNLQRLWLNSNQLTQVPDFTHMPNLQMLDLSSNQLTQVPDFAHLQELQWLNLVVNPVIEQTNWSQRRQELLNLHPRLIRF